MVSSLYKLQAKRKFLPCDIVIDKDKTLFLCRLFRKRLA